MLRRQIMFLTTWQWIVHETQYLNWPHFGDALLICPNPTSHETLAIGFVQFFNERTRKVHAKWLHSVHLEPFRPRSSEKYDKLFGMRSNAEVFLFTWVKVDDLDTKIPVKSSLLMLFIVPLQVKMKLVFHFKCYELNEDRGKQTFCKIIFFPSELNLRQRIPFLSTIMENGAF